MKKLALVLSFSILLFGLGCNSNSKKGKSLCQKTVNTLRSCGLISEGTVNCDSFVADVVGLEKCEIECIANAECDDLDDLVCDDLAVGAFAICVEACEEEFTFECTDELDQINMEDVCNCEEDCDDGSDEDDCPANYCFDCGDGSLIPADWACDCLDDCDDGSDEDGCPTADCFDCGDGSLIPTDWACDCEEDCDGGPDEAGCPANTCFDCGDGSSVPTEWVCDLEEDCDDGSDEEDGCAEFVCPEEKDESFSR